MPANYNFWPGDLPAETDCPECGETWEIRASSSWTFSEDINPEDDKAYHDSELPTYDVPTSKRRKYIVYCPCGRRMAEILDPHWPGGASGGYVEDPPEERV